MAIPLSLHPLRDALVDVVHEFRRRGLPLRFDYKVSARGEFVFAVLVGPRYAGEFGDGPRKPRGH